MLVPSKFHGEKYNFFEEQWIFLGEGPKFIRKKCSFSSGDMFVPKGKKNLRCSSGQLKLLFGDMIIPWWKANFLKEQWTSPRERPKFPEKTYVLKLLAIIIISYLFLYRLATYHRKALEENYNFVIESMSITIHMKKL